MKNLDRYYDENKKEQVTLFFQNLAMKFGMTIPGLVAGITFFTALVEADCISFPSVNFLVIVQWTLHVKNGSTPLFVTFVLPFTFIMRQNVTFERLFFGICLMTYVASKRFWGWRLNRNRLDWTGLGGNGWINRNRLDILRLGRNTYVIGVLIFDFFCCCEYWLFYLDFGGDEHYFIFTWIFVWKDRKIKI